MVFGEKASNLSGKKIPKKRQKQKKKDNYIVKKKTDIQQLNLSRSLEGNLTVSGPRTCALTEVARGQTKGAFLINILIYRLNQRKKSRRWVRARGLGGGGGGESEPLARPVAWTQKPLKIPSESKGVM